MGNFEKSYPFFYVLFKNFIFIYTYIKKEYVWIIKKLFVSL